MSITLVAETTAKVSLEYILTLKIIIAINMYFKYFNYFPLLFQLILKSLVVTIPLKL